MHINKNIQNKIGSDRKVLATQRTKSRRCRYIFPFPTVSGRITLLFLITRSLAPRSNHSKKSTGKKRLEPCGVWVCVPPPMCTQWKRPPAESHTHKRRFQCVQVHADKGGRRISGVPHCQRCNRRGDRLLRESVCVRVRVFTCLVMESMSRT